MPRVKRLFKPSLDNPQDIFNYGKECGIDQEQDRIIEMLAEQASLLSVNDAAFVLAIIDFIKGEDDGL